MKPSTFYDGCATHYDADYASAGYEHDIPFYVERAKASGGPVLELGCGTGRVLVEIARAGIEIVGVDLSEEMLARAEERLAAEPAEVRERVRLIHSDLRTVTVDGGIGRFPLVTSPFRVVQHLVSRDDQKAWLRTVRAHLAPPRAGRSRPSDEEAQPGASIRADRADRVGEASPVGQVRQTDRPGGELIFDVFQPDFTMIAESLDETAPSLSVDVQRVDPETGRTVRRVSRALHTPELQTFDVTFEWLLEEPDGTSRTERSVESTVRWFTRAELENLLELEGFDVLDVWGDFAGTPFGEGSEDLVVRARLAG